MRFFNDDGVSISSENVARTGLCDVIYKTFNQFNEILSSFCNQWERIKRNNFRPVTVSCGTPAMLRAQ